MNCSRCGTELPESATFCPRCGEAYEAGQPGTFTYLPAGVPPWPTSVPQDLLHASKPAASGQSASMAGAKGKESSARSRPKILSIIAPLVLVPLVGVLATLGILYINGDFSARNNSNGSNVHAVQSGSNTPAPSSSSSGLPSPSSFKKLSDADLNVSLQYPADWTQESPQKTAASSVLGIHSSQQFGITFNVVRFSDTSSSSISDPNQINQVAISQFSGQQGVSNVQLLKPANSQPTIGGAKWVQAEAMVIATNGLKFHIATISVQHNKDYYNIQVFAPDDYYSEAVQKYIQPMLSSWQFLS